MAVFSIMEVTSGPDTYIPKMNIETKTYLDQYVFDYSRGIQCPCTPTKIFYKRDSFHAHWKCNKHKKWLMHLNENAENFYRETIEQQKTIKTQQTILTELENQLKQKEVIIQYLERNLQKKTQFGDTGDLLDFD